MVKSQKKNIKLKQKIRLEDLKHWRKLLRD